MVQPKYSPQEALERAKLMMKYDTSKTLTENKHVKSPENKINEQTSACPNSFDYDELLEISRDAGNIVKKMQMTFVRMGYGPERAKELYDLIQTLIGKNVVDDITSECMPAISKFEKMFKDPGSRGWFESGFDLKKKLKEFINGYYKDDAEAKRYLKATLDLLDKNKNVTTNQTTEPQNQTGYPNDESGIKKFFDDTYNVDVNKLTFKKEGTDVYNVTFGSQTLKYKFSNGTFTKI